MPGKIWAYLFIILAVIGLVKWSHTQVYNQGYNAHKSEVSDGKDDAEEKDKGAVKTVIKWRTIEKVVTRDKIKKIYIKEDPTGCRNTKLIDMGISLH